MADFVTARTRMVDNQLRASNVMDHRILAVMGEVAREAFLPVDQAALAYADVAHALGDGRYLAPPAPFARLLQLAEIQHTDTVLDIGTGTGYSAAVLARLGASVTALESVPTLADTARANLAAAGVVNATVVAGPLDGVALPAGAFDVVIVEGTLDSEPTGLFRLLADGGRLVALIGNGGAAVAHVFVRAGEEVAGRAEFNTTLPRLALAPKAEAFVF
ncbi:MAG: protein-L-isoaspartate O-methyltransferase [Devosia sp.]|uniref:protein-L-isoaspartate O-methyltransferase family protein n=1 Tax=Devosia sp. TaxID=1871048 RepID=UPI001AC782AB|nr:protein-L-isoaspartate O-methyltransferase [Devosia sp.]MBN9314647.1 protein-L-isoaspartate O-methyltransferase [Devosia sp.]